MKRYLFFSFILFSASYALAADITGRVISLQSTKDINTSGLTNLERKKFEDSLVVSSDNGLANTVVYIEKMSPANYSSNKHSKVEVDQINNAFIPRVVAMMVGDEITVINSDKIFHNVHAYLNGENLFIANLPHYKQESTHVLDREGIISMKCEVHLDMQAYAAVLSNPYFSLTDKNGEYIIKDVPPGEYNLITWHELLSKQTKKIAIKKDGRAAQINFTYEHITTISPRWY